MKNFILVAFCTAAVLFTTGCGCGHKPSVLTAVADAKNYADKVAEGQKASEDRWQQRKAKGDTLAMPYADLQGYLPDVSGYTKNGGPKGSQMNMPGMGGGFSQAEQEYTNGDKTITVTIVDYNAAYQAFVGATAMFKMGYAVEDDDKKSGAVDLGIKDVAAYQTVYKKNPQGELALIAGDRFMIGIKSQGSNDADLLASVAKSMKLSELAAK